jgi:hypothetical protein
MKILTSILLLPTLALALLAQLQQQSGSQGTSQAGQNERNQSNQNETSTNHKVKRNMSGTVSQDRKTITDDNNNKGSKWTTPIS